MADANEVLGTTLAELEALGRSAPAKPPEMEDQPEPRTAPVPGYVNRGTLCRVAQKTIRQESVEEVTSVLPPGRTVELQARIVEDGTLLALQARIGFGKVTRSVEIPTSITQDSRSGAKVLAERTGYPWTASNATELSKWIIVASQVDEAPTVRVTSAPRWAGDYLLVPGVNARGRRSAYGVRTGCSEDDAQAAWQRVVEIGEDNPRFAVYVGAAIIASFEQPSLRADELALGQTLSNQGGSAL
jgi:hypothetical protein